MKRLWVQDIKIRMTARYARGQREAYRVIKKKMLIGDQGLLSEPRRGGRVGDRAASLGVRFVG